MNVSILVATYGEESWRTLAHERALPSARAQEPYEVLDGHALDGTISEARNALAEMAKGDWLCFLDADDELGRGYLAAMQQAYERRRRDDGTPPLLTPAVSYVRKGKQQPARFLSGHDLSKNNYLVVGTLVQRDLFMQVGGFSDYPHGFEDWSLWAKCWKAGAEVVKVRRAIYFAYWNRNSKHRIAWRNRRWQVQMHQQVQRDLFPETYA